MAFPIYLHDLKPAVDGRDSHARQAARHEDVGVSDDRPSIWKRELSFGRRKQQPENDATVGADTPVEEPEFEIEPPVAEHEPEPELENERRSIWKREVSFGRKRGHDDETSTEPEAASEETVFDLGETVDDGSESQNERRSIWKRELSFGRKHDQEDGPEPDTEPLVRRAC